jgi:hypothetical protein
MIQRMFLKGIGYDPDHGTAERQRIFSVPIMVQAETQTTPQSFQLILN